MFVCMYVCMCARICLYSTISECRGSSGQVPGFGQLPITGVGF